MPQWTVLIYIQADGFLKKGADRAVQDLLAQNAALFGLGIKLFVEVNSQVERVRYFENKQLVCDPGLSHEVCLKAACEWAFKTPTAHTMLIISGHGCGILDPVYDTKLNRWLCARDKGDSYFTRYQNRQACEQAECIVHLTEQHKSLFHESGTGDYISSAHIGTLIKDISATVLNGRKIDIIGFDACHMAMLEIAYDLRSAASIIVASQECEEKGGWNYADLVRVFEKETDPRSIARALVYAYGKSERKKEHELFCLSAIDLGGVVALIPALNRVTGLLNTCLLTRKTEFHDLLCRVRNNNQRFCSVSMYADLLTFLQALLAELPSIEATEEIDELQEAILDAYELVEGMTLASTTGPLCSLAQGCSLYFPRVHIDSSYLRCSFAQESQWLAFLNNWLWPTPR